MPYVRLCAHVPGREQVGFSGKAPIWAAASADATRAEATLAKYKADFVEKAAAPQRARVASALDQVTAALPALKEATKAQNYEATVKAQTEAAEALAQARELLAMNAPKGPLTFKVDEDYAKLPRLEGRAKVRLTFKRGQGARRGWLIAAIIIIIVVIILVF